MANLSTIADAIQRQEGYYQGSLAYRNNNPGNLRYAGQTGATQGAGGFAYFPDYASGRAALENQIRLDALRGKTLAEFLHKYAPASENDTDSYITNMTAWTGIQPGQRLIDVIGGDGSGGGGDFSAFESSASDIDPVTVGLIGAGAFALWWFFIRR